MAHDPNSPHRKGRLTVPSHRAAPRRWFQRRRPQSEGAVPPATDADATDAAPTAAASPVISTVPAAPPLDADSAPTSVIPRVPAAGEPVVEPAPSAPSRVTLHYPDGHTHALDCLYDGPSAIDDQRHRWVAVVPNEARLVNGMVVRVDRETVLAVSVRDRTGLPRPL